MSDATLNIFRQQKYDILDRRIKKQRSKLLLHSGNTDKSYTNTLISSNTITDEQKRKLNMLSIMKKPKINIPDINDQDIDPFSEFNNYEYHTHPKNKNINMSYFLIPEWLPHPNPKYRDQIVKRFCLYGKNCDGISKSTDGPCHELHPVRWNCFPSEYLTILSKLPEHKQPKYHQNIILPPVWAHLTFRYQNASTAKNKGHCCQYGITCNKVFVCPFKHPIGDHQYAVCMQNNQIQYNNNNINTNHISIIHDNHVITMHNDSPIHNSHNTTPYITNNHNNHH
jgi:hypothetical protein